MLRHRRLPTDGPIRALGTGGALPPERPQASRSGLRGAKTTTEAPTGAVGPLSAVYGAMSEREFQKHVVDALKQRGWLVFVIPDMRRTLAGWPDLICLKSDWDMMLALELKREKGGRVSAKQREVLTILGHILGVVTRVLRPSEWPPFLAWIDSVEREPTR